MDILKRVRVKRLFQTILVVTVYLELNVNVATFDWPSYRGPTHNGISQEKGYRFDSATKLWETSINTGFSGITVAEAKLYTMGNKDDQDIVYCIDKNTGDIIWKYEYDCRLAPKSYEGGPNVTPTVNDGRVYTLSREGHIFCFQSDRGMVLWKWNVAKEFRAKPPSGGFSGSPSVLGDAVIFNVGASGLALNRLTGKTLWSSGKGPAGYATPLPYTIDDKTLIAILNGKELKAIDPQSGKVLWGHRWKTFLKINAATPIFFNNQMFISSGYNEGCTLLDVSGAQPTLLWKNKSMRNQFNSSVFWNGHIYGIDGNVGRRNKLKCISATHGDIKWAVKDFGFGSLILADEQLIILTHTGELVIVKANPEKYEEIHREKILDGKCWTVPTLSNGRLFARNAKGKLICLEFKKI